jgi:hypothetical protein
VLGGWGGRGGRLGGTGPRPKALEEGALGNRQDDGVQRRARSGRPAAFKGGRGWCCGVGRLPRSTRGPWQARLAGGADDGPPGNTARYDAVKTAHVPWTAGAKGTTALTSRRWGTSRTHTEAGATAGARRAA